MGAPRAGDVPPARRLDAIVSDAGALLALVDGANAASTSLSSWSDVGAALDLGPGVGPGSVARIVVAQDAVTGSWRSCASRRRGG